MSRFTDIDLANTDLGPISGYWAYSLVSLEQALEPFLSRIEQLDRSIKAAKRYCHYPSEHGLTKDESAAVYLYTMEGGDNSFYLVLNKALRMEDRRTMKPWFPFLKLFDTAIGKLPTVRTNIWRGVPGDMRKDFKKDRVFTWWSVSSCSLSTEVIEEFLPTGTISTLFMIEAINGKNIAGYTAFPNEDEVLLGVGTQLRVKSNALKHGGGLHVVHLAEVAEDSDEQLSSAMASAYVTPPLSNKDLAKASNTTAASTSKATASAHVASTKSHTKAASSYTPSPPPPPPSAQKKVEYCGGNACATCGKCRDWRYDGNFQRDLDRWERDNKCDDIFDRNRWHRSSDATCRPGHSPGGSSHLPYYGHLGLGYGGSSLGPCVCADNNKN